MYELAELQKQIGQRFQDLIALAPQFHLLLHRLQLDLKQLASEQLELADLHCERIYNLKYTEAGILKLKHFCIWISTFSLCRHQD